MQAAHPDDAYALAPSLRPVDKRELELAWDGSEDIGDLLAASVEMSGVTYSITDDTGVIHGMWGHGDWVSGPTRAGMGYVWLLSDEALFREHAITMTGYARRVVFPYLDRRYSAYGNFLLAENLVHIRWLLGANFKRAAPATIGGEAFSLYLRTPGEPHV